MPALAPSILLFDGDHARSDLVPGLLRAAVPDCTLDHADRFNDGLKRLTAGGYNAVIIDLGSPSAPIYTVLTRLRAAAPDVPIIVLSDDEDEEAAVACLRQGAHDYLIKRRIDGDSLARALRYAGERARHEVSRQQGGPATIRDISKRTEVRQGPDLAELLDEAYDAVIVRDPSTSIIVYWNRGAEQLYGWTAAEAEGQVSYDLLSTRSSAPLAQMVEAMDRDGQWFGELTHTTREQRRVVVESRWLLRRDTKRRPTAILEINHDITVRKHAEETRAQLAAIVEESGDAIIGKTLTGVITSWNRAATRLYGYTADEAIGQPITMLAPPNHHGEVGGLTATATQGENSAKCEAEYFRKDGSSVVVEVTNAPVRDAEGTVVGAWVVARDISARKAAEAALRVTEERLRAVVRNAPILIFAIDRDGRYTLTEGQALTSFGSTSDNLAGRSIYEAYPALTEVHDAVRRALAGEKNMLRAKLAGRTSETRYVPERDERGEVVGVIGVSTDITERVLVETALRESEERFRLAFDEAPIGMSLAAFDGQVLEVNQALCHMLGYSEQELLDQHTPDLTHPDDVAESRERMRQLVAAEIDSITLQKRYLHKQGQTIWTSYTASLLRSADGAPLYFIYQLQDITAHKAAEEALRASEALFRALVERAPVGACIVNEHGAYETVNDAYCALAGFAREELLGRHFTITMPDALHEEMTDRYAARFDGQQEALLRTKDGRQRNVVLGTLRIVGPDDRPRRVSFFTDITERVESARALAAAREAMLTAEHDNAVVLQHGIRELARSNAELEQFASVASHDLRSPLNTIGSFAQLLSLNYAGKLDSDADDFLAFIMEAVTRMQQLIDDLLAFARVGAQEDSAAPVDCAALVARVIAQLGEAIGQTGTEVSVQDLPVVFGQSSQLEQVFQNLIANAIKFHGNAPPRVAITARSRGNEWLFSVQDNGIGIDAANLERIFVLFQRLHTREEYPGTGIGLAVCKKIVERHGGSIVVKSAPDQGTQVLFTLPGMNTAT